ncbi:hypothetical protein DFJ73DRAFT_815785 [Zopfochytrium polystomum]|nr:hypothetical protein DFJ73DRAFT_815785 [Zopfochytrium polystomum]
MFLFWVPLFLAPVHSLLDLAPICLFNVSYRMSFPGEEMPPTGVLLLQAATIKRQPLLCDGCSGGSSAGVAMGVLGGGANDGCTSSTSFLDN